MEPGVICMRRMALKTVTPAQRIGAYFAASTWAGIGTPDSERRVQYSPSDVHQSSRWRWSSKPPIQHKPKHDLQPPFLVIPLMSSLSHIWNRPFLHALHEPCRCKSGQSPCASSATKEDFTELTIVSSVPEISLCQSTSQMEKRHKSPCSPNPIPNLPCRLAISHGCDVPNDFMTRYHRTTLNELVSLRSLERYAHHHCTNWFPFEGIPFRSDTL
jgi:hypothetical protein